MYLLAVLFQKFFFPFCIFLVPNQFILWFYNIFFFFYKYILDLREKKCIHKSICSVRIKTESTKYHRKKMELKELTLEPKLEAHL